MALKRWAWLWGPAVAALGLVIGLLPPGIPSGEGLLAAFGQPAYERVYHGPDAFREAVQRALNTQRRRLHETRLADSLVRAARGASALQSEDGMLTLVYERPLTRDSALVWLRAAVAELALYPEVSTPGLPVVVALLSNPARRRSEAEPYLSFPTLVLRSAAAHSGACVVAVNLVSRWNAWTLVARDASGRPLGRVLDSCALYSRFGIPGAAVGSWADRGPNWYWGAYDQLGARLQEAGRRVRPDSIPAWVEYSTPWLGAVPWLQIGCLHGATALCSQVAGLEVRRDGLPSFSYSFTRGQILAYLLTRGTPAQFATFWRSTLPPARALQAAYGEPAGGLAMSAYRHWAVVSGQVGPRAGARTVLVGIGWAGIALALAIVAGRRRTGEP